ncbi:MAG: T9SS type A sorting domain-containing protein [Bacteroidales bacterium]|nr:T9SS type A sorting domain-containing protein [Bacteroidales bacterium]
MKVTVYLAILLLWPVIAFSQAVQIGDILCTDGNEAFTLSCIPSGNIRAGNSACRDKASSYRVRAVRNLSFVNPSLPESGLPDNIIETDCNRPLEGTPWDIQMLHASSENDIASYSPILAGDIDADGVTDIVVARYTDNAYHSNGMYVFNGTNLAVQSIINLPDTIYNYNGYAIGRYPLDNGEMQGAIFVHSYDKRIRAYDIHGTLLRVSDRPTTCHGMLSLADFNGDGYPELYSGSDIFDAATLKWLCSGPADGNKGLGFRGPPLQTAVNTHHTYYAMSLAYNVLDDTRQELICGNTIYNVDIVSRTNPTLNSITVNKTVTPPSGFTQDGHVLIADFDLDGESEVLVLRDNTDDHTNGNIYIYAYKPSTGQILFQKAHHAFCTSYPFVGNIDEDPYPEIVLLEKQLYSTAYLFCWRFTPSGGLSTVWQQEHNDSSGQTGLTLFDFNQDGIMELVYRDNKNLRILNGSGKSHITGNDTIQPYDLYSKRMSAGTGVEYPIVADVNGDGYAEIVATGLLNSTEEVGYGGLHIFGSPGNWSPARPVWNQYMYHVTNVNEDLTIPTFCFDKATVFTAPDGTVRRPYNNFLQQAYYINQYGEPYNPGGVIEADLSASGCTSFTFHGTTYNESGSYDQLVETSSDCDTLYHIDVSIGGTVTHEIYDVFCGEYPWNDSVYHEPGDYVQQFVAPAGCDSIVTLHLSLGSLPAVPNIVGPQEVFVSTDLVLGEYFYSIEPVEGATAYEWELEGANWVLDPDGAHCRIVVTTTGMAILRVKVWNDCGLSEQEIVIYADFHDVDEFTTIPVDIYPNPANDKVFVEADGIVKIKLYDLKGRCVMEVFCDRSPKAEIDLQSLSSRLYIVEVVTEQGIARTKLTIESK